MLYHLPAHPAQPHVLCGDTGAPGEEGTRTQGSELQFKTFLSYPLWKTHPGLKIPVTRASYSDVRLCSAPSS